MKPQIKYRTIRSNKYGYSIAYLCKFFGVSRSGYYKWLKRQDMPDKDLILREYIGECQDIVESDYGLKEKKD